MLCLCIMKSTYVSMHEAFEIINNQLSVFLVRKQ